MTAHIFSNTRFSKDSVIKVIIFVCLVALAILATNKLKQITYFPIKSVKVFGVHNVDQQEIQRLLLPLIGNGFFAVNVESIKERLLQLPWVAKVIVIRSWPNQVSITLVEKKVLARWNNASLLSRSGDLFSPASSTYPTELPDFIGPEGQQIAMMKYYAQLNNLLMPLHFKITRLELTPYKSWILMLDNGIKLSVSYKDILTRINHFVKVYPKIIGDRAADVEHVDLRYSNGMAVRWKTVT